MTRKRLTKTVSRRGRLTTDTARGGTSDGIRANATTNGGDPRQLQLALEQLANEPGPAESGGRGVPALFAHESLQRLGLLLRPSSATT
jgi:hypothetical protein